VGVPKKHNDFGSSGTYKKGTSRRKKLLPKQKQLLIDRLFFEKNRLKALIEW
jgi:hypothetical protein